ncbi:MAG: hypothetical protein V4772_21340 [Pseudomonadota bacterium]
MKFMKCFLLAASVATVSAQAAISVVALKPSGTQVEKPGVERSVFLISNSHEKSAAPLLGTKKDVDSMRGIAETVELHNASAALMLAGIKTFAAEQKDCESPTAPASLIWFTGHADNSSDEFFLLGNDMHKLAFADVLAALAPSSCRFVLGMDAHTSKLAMALPKNVIVIWPNALGEAGFDTPNGGVLTRAFVATVNAGLLGLPVDWTATLQAATAGINPPQKQMPWVQYNKAGDLMGWRLTRLPAAAAAPASR